jgi:CheY-like chemotaxis protein
MAEQPLVLLIEPQVARHRHAAALEKAGFRSASVLADHVDIDRVLDQRPAVIAAELDGSAAGTLELARRLRQNPRTRLIPLVIYGHDLRPQHIEDAARAGALWLQLEPSDGARLVAAVRGVVAASHRDG